MLVNVAVIRFHRQRLAREAIMAAKEISVKKYVVRLSGEERERLETLIRKGKSPARRVLKARILLKADVSEAAAEPAEQPADVIEPDCDGELVWRSSES
jgi:hypothetical protein